MPNRGRPSLLGDHDDWDVAGLGTRGEFALDVVSPEARERQIEHDQVRRRLLDMSERVNAIFNSQYRVSGSHEYRTVHLAKGTIILDNQYGRLPCLGKHRRMIWEFVPSRKPTCY